MTTCERGGEWVIKNDDIEKIVKEIRKVNGSIQIVVLNFPAMGTKSPTDLEKYIIEHHESSETLIEYARKKSAVPRAFQQFDYAPEDIVEILTAPEQMLINKKLVLSDRYGKLVNIRDGCRLTCFQPDEYAHTIYFTGGCRVYGIGSEDASTIPSLLQDMINRQTKFKYSVENFGQLYGGGGKKYLMFPHIREVAERDVKEGDILVICGSFTPGRRNPSYPFVDSQLYFTKPYKYGDVFFEEKLPHLNRNGNRLVAECLFDFLMSKKMLKDTKVVKLNNREHMAAVHPVLKDCVFMKQLEEYKTYLARFRNDAAKVCGGICMNANPFTYGHRFLVESAASQVDQLYIFVAEENKTMFPFKDRFEMIKAGVADLKNVSVIRGGIFVGSVITFPEYYDREARKNMKILPSLDLMIFADHIAPVFNITKRFVGTEPLCPITSQYNKQLREILPKKGIELIEFKRKEIGDKVVSASYVRSILKQWENGDYSEVDVARLKELVPATTFKHLESKFAAIFPKAL